RSSADGFSHPPDEQCALGRADPEGASCRGGGEGDGCEGRCREGDRCEESRRDEEIGSPLSPLASSPCPSLPDLIRQSMSAANPTSTMSPGQAPGLTGEHVACDERKSRRSQTAGARGILRGGSTRSCPQASGN